MKFIVLVAALLALTSAAMLEEEELLAPAVCKKALPKVAAWMKAADKNHNGVLHKVEAWIHYRNTKLAPHWNKWFAAHGKKLSAEGKKAYWKKRIAFMKKHRAMFMKKWAAMFGKAPALKIDVALKKWYVACLKK